MHNTHNARSCSNDYSHNTPLTSLLRSTEHPEVGRWGHVAPAMKDTSIFLPWILGPFFLFAVCS